MLGQPKSLARSIWLCDEKISGGRAHRGMLRYRVRRREGFAEEGAQIGLIAGGRAGLEVRGAKWKPRRPGPWFCPQMWLTKIGWMARPQK
jgi:hypothetical protein